MRVSCKGEEDDDKRYERSGGGGRMRNKSVMVKIKTAVQQDKTVQGKIKGNERGERGRQSLSRRLMENRREFQTSLAHGSDDGAYKVRKG